MIERIKGIVRRRLIRLRYLLSRRQGIRVPAPPLWHLPEGFTVHRLAHTGIRVIDNFCTGDEAARLIELCREKVQRSTVINEKKESVVHAYRTSSDLALSVDHTDPVLKDMAYRAAGILGLPIGCVERVSITRYRKGEYYKSHFDHDGSMKADRLYTVLIYLNDLAPEQGGGTMFPELKLVATPVQGRAVCWVNSDPDKSVRPESRHSALPVLADDAEKWVVQLWLRGYECNPNVAPVYFAKPPEGRALTDADSLPVGVQVVGDVDEDALFGTTVPAGAERV